jgi:hypothetical protein
MTNTGKTVMILKIHIITEKIRVKTVNFYSHGTATYAGTTEHNIGFRENRQLFCTKLAKIDENGSSH